MKYVTYVFKPRVPGSAAGTEPHALPGTVYIFWPQSLLAQKKDATSDPDRKIEPSGFAQAWRKNPGNLSWQSAVAWATEQDLWPTAAHPFTPETEFTDILQVWNCPCSSWLQHQPG